MQGYPLQSVLDLRRREEEAAATELANATRRRVAAEEEEERRMHAVAQARSGWERARRQGELVPESDAVGEGGCVAATDALAIAWFVDRRRAELNGALEQLARFGAGELAAARAAEKGARSSHLAARRARDLLDKHAAKYREAGRVVTDRREEAALEDAARTAARAQRHEATRASKPER